MAGLPCPNWEYNDIPDISQLLFDRANKILIEILSSDDDGKVSLCFDTRPKHETYFFELTPPNLPHFAGHYRGERYECLEGYRVHIPSDSRVGHDPADVLKNMDAFKRDIKKAVDDCDSIWRLDSSKFSEDEKLNRTIKLLVALFVYFLEIHPYANGNGHMARLILISLLSRYKIFLSQWLIEPKPRQLVAGTSYSDCIKLHRDGQVRALEHFVLSCI